MTRLPMRPSSRTTTAAWPPSAIYQRVVEHMNGTASNVERLFVISNERMDQSIVSPNVSEDKYSEHS